MNQGVQVNNEQSNTNQDNTFSKERGAALGGTRTHDTALQALMLYCTIFLPLLFDLVRVIITASFSLP